MGIHRLIHMWPFKKTTDSLQQTTFLELRSHVESLETRMLRLEEQFRSLRGYVYAKKGIVGPPGEGPSGEISPPRSGVAAPQAAAPMSRDELRRSLVTTGRFVPGKPPVHGE